MTRVSVPKHAPRSLAEPSGVLLVDKPTGMTSHDVVDVVRRLCGIRQIGHTGTLDPAASGLLILLLGRAAKIASYLSALPKSYLAQVHFGQVSETGDSEGQLSTSGDPSLVSGPNLAEILRGIVGEITQKVPAYAAVRSGGRRRYDLARSGQDVPLLERRVTIHSADLISCLTPVAEVRICCSSGTYIRSLAEMLGEMMGCGAYLDGLRREAVGPWSVTQAFTLDQLTVLLNRQASTRLVGTADLSILRPIEEFLRFPRITLSEACVSAVLTGPPLRANSVMDIQGKFVSGETVTLCDANGHVLAVATARFDSCLWPDACPQNELFRYQRVLA